MRGSRPRPIRSRYYAPDPQQPANGRVDRPSGRLARKRMRARRIRAVSRPPRGAETSRGNAARRACRLCGVDTRARPDGNTLNVCRPSAEPTHGAGPPGLDRYARVDRLWSRLTLRGEAVRVDWLSGQLAPATHLSTTRPSTALGVLTSRRVNSRRKPTARRSCACRLHGAATRARAATGHSDGQSPMSRPRKGSSRVAVSTCVARCSRC